MNILLLVFDTLRKDCIGAFGAPPWGAVHTPNLNALAAESVVFNRAYPETLPTLPARRALYTGRRVYPFHNSNFFLKGDFVGAPGWGPIPEDHATLAEILRDSGKYRTALISDIPHMFKPSKNFTRGFDQWTFLRGQEIDPHRSGPRPTQAEVDRWLAPELQELSADLGGRKGARHDFISQCIMNMYDRHSEEDYFAAALMREAARWLEDNRDADNFFLTIECFDPHEPWFVPEHYRRRYDDSDGQDHVISMYGPTQPLNDALLRRARANYSGLVTMVDRWFGYLYDALNSLGRLDDTVVIVMSDHGHVMGEGGYMGKRGYPSEPAVFDTVLMIRHPDNTAGVSDHFVQHIDVTAQVLEFAGVRPSDPLDGVPVWANALKADRGARDHVTVGWGAAMTVINADWWMNCKVDGSGPFLYRSNDFSTNVADEHPEIVQELYRTGLEDAGDGVPPYLIELAQSAADAPGCSVLAARA